MSNEVAIRGERVLELVRDFSKTDETASKDNAERMHMNMAHAVIGEVYVMRAIRAGDAEENIRVYIRKLAKMLLAVDDRNPKPSA